MQSGLFDKETEFISRISAIERKGTGEFIDYLKSTDFFSAPASSNHHSNFDGGLCHHSLIVANQARIINEACNLGLDPKSVELVCLTHDICKANYYRKEERWRKNSQGKWESYMGWIVKEELPLGHGEKSLVLVNKFISLTPSEMATIRWHMGAFDPGTAFSYPSGNPFHQALKDYPLLTLLMSADMFASQVIEEVYEL